MPAADIKAATAERNLGIEVVVIGGGDPGPEIVDWPASTEREDRSRNRLRGLYGFGVIVADSRLCGSKRVRLGLGFGKPADRGNPHRCAVATASIGGRIIRKRPVDEHAAVTSIGIAAHERAQCRGEIRTAHDRVGYRQAAHRVVGEAAVRMEQFETGWRRRVTLEARSDDIAGDSADHDPSPAGELLAIYFASFASKSGK